MSKVLYFLATFAESGMSVFGARGLYDTPSYAVVQHVAPDIEIRAYGSRAVVQTAVTDGGDGEAFGKLFRYITGANATGRLVPMTVPVMQTPRAPGPSTLETTMAFYLPPSIATNPPAPKEAGVDIAVLPAATLGVIRFSGVISEALRAQKTALLRDALRRAGRSITGAPQSFSYDPPFAIPFLRRNEVAIEVSP